jgi:hypothetical protein
MPTYQLETIRVKPRREILLDTSGLLLGASAARYDSLGQYRDMFCTEVSSLPGAGIFCFQDPLAPRWRILVECDERDWCGRCDQSLDDCSCPF